MNLTTIILTYNEEVHIERVLDSVNTFSDRIIIIDSGSTDRTIDIARKFGAEIKINPFVNQAKQFNWAIDQLPKDTKWVLRIDADEIVSLELSRSIKNFLNSNNNSFNGAMVKRRMTFLQKPIKYGGLFPLKVLRLFRYGYGRSEEKWMDEHIIVEGKVTSLKGELIDDNLNSLSWWIDKHNNYASREVITILSKELMCQDQNNEKNILERETELRRKFKESFYHLMPHGLRAFIYFTYRYVVRFGFLDGKNGTAFHFFQSLWYRYLVDSKLREVKAYKKKYNVDYKNAILKVLDIDLDN